MDCKYLFLPLNMNMMSLYACKTIRSQMALSLPQE